jgi:predicted hydrocarbon binding protein
MFQRFKSLAVNIHPVVGRVFLMLCLVSITGCSTVSSIEKSTKRMVRDFRAPDSDLKKRVGILLFENKTNFAKKDVEEKFIRDLSDIIASSCPNILLEKPGDPDYPDDLTRVPRTRSGWIDNLELAKTGRKLGLNAIVTGGLITITPNKRKKGILWLKDTHYYVQVRIDTEVYDTETGAKLLDESFVHEIEVDEMDLESVSADSELNTLIVDEAFVAIADKMGEKICKAIVFQPWKGFIASIDSDKILFNFGKNIGLKIGDLFEVFDSTSIFEGLEGQRFFKPGQKTGEIKITSLYPDTAEAILVSGHDIRPGFCVQPKE